VFSTVTKLSISDATFDLGNGFDQRKGLALLFQRASQRMMACSGHLTLSKLRRRMA